jgi:hypothetical protein
MRGLKTWPLLALILRSAPKERVSKDEAAPSFETPPKGPLLRMWRR